MDLDSQPVADRAEGDDKKIDMAGKLRWLVVTLIVISGCAGDNNTKSTGDDSDSTRAAVLRPDNEIRGARIGLFEGSVKTTDIRADYIEKYTKQDSTLAWKLEVDFYDRQGKQTSRLVADSGLVREAIKLMVANGHVVVVSEDGARLETEQLFWNGTTQMITTDSFVTVYQHGDTLMGYGLEADQRLNKVKIKKRVRGTTRNAEKLTE
jgi:LPS export ABC transporter protein LptC